MSASWRCFDPGEKFVLMCRNDLGTVNSLGGDIVPLFTAWEISWHEYGGGGGGGGK